MSIHQEAFSQGIQAQFNGFEVNDPSANPYVEYGKESWLYRSFCAGWADADTSKFASAKAGEDGDG